MSEKGACLYTYPLSSETRFCVSMAANAHHTGSVMHKLSLVIPTHEHRVLHKIAFERLTVALAADGARRRRPTGKERHPHRKNGLSCRTCAAETLWEHDHSIAVCPIHGTALHRTKNASNLVRARTLRLTIGDTPVESGMARAACSGIARSRGICWSRGSEMLKEHIRGESDPRRRKC